MKVRLVFTDVIFPDAIIFEINGPDEQRYRELKVDKNLV